MAINKWICVRQTYNSRMGNECWKDETTVSYFDKNGWVKVGDIVECERDEKGFYIKIWVNGILKEDKTV